jgi:hypothetical protein
MSGQCQFDFADGFCHTHRKFCSMAAMAADVALTATRDEVLATERGWQFIATTREGGSFRVFGPADDSGLRLFAASRRLGLLALVTRTGIRETRGQVRCRVDVAVYTGDVAGTLRFDGPTTRGVVPAAAFVAANPSHTSV